MAVKTYRLGVGNDGNFAALAETDQAAANRTDGWTVGKIAATNQSDFDAGTKQVTGTFAISAKPASFLTGATANAFKAPAALAGTFANTAWSFTFALRCTVASAQQGRIRLRVFKSANADGSAATELTGATVVSSTGAVTSTTADTNLTATWSPGALTLSNEFLFFVLAWEITTVSGSNTADAVFRTGQASAGSRVVTPDFALAPTSVTVGAVASAQAFGTTAATTPQTVTVVGLGPAASVPLVDTFVVDDGTVVDGSAGISGAFGVPVVAITIPATNVPVSGVATAQSFGAPTIQTVVVKPTGGVSSAQAFGTPTIRGAITRTVGAVNSAQAFGTVILAQTGGPQTRAVSGVSSAQVFGSLAFRVTLGTGGVVTAQAFGTPIIKAVVTRAVIGLGSAQSFGVPTIRTAITKPSGGVSSAQAFGTPVVTVKGPPQTVVVPGVYPFGYTVTAVSTTGQVVSGDGHLVGGGVASTAAQFGVPTLQIGSFSITISVGGVASVAAFGALTIKTAVSKLTGGVSSAQAFGTVTIIKGAVSRAVTGVVSAQAFGVPVVAAAGALPQTRSVTGVGSAQQFGLFTPGLGSPQTVQVLGLQQVGGWGLSITGQVITGDGHLVLGGGGGLFGQVVIRTAVRTTLIGLGSAQAFGVVQITWPQWIPVGGVPSAARFGQPDVFHVWLYLFDCLDLDLDASECLPAELSPSLVEDLDLAVSSALDFTLTPASEESLDLQSLGCE